MNLDGHNNWNALSGRHIIPNLPDLILYRIFELLSYKQIVRLEIICRRWRTIIHRLLKKHIQDLNVEQSITYSKIYATQQKPLKRLSVCCNFEVVDFLSGVLRRSRASITKLSCDIRFLAYIEQLNLDREANRRYWSNVEDLWMVVVQLDNVTTEKFLNICKLLFLNLSRVTIQIHESAKQGINVCRIITAIVDQFPKLMINMEIHARSSVEVFDQLRLFPPLKLESLKLICLDYKPETLSLTELAKIVERRRITVSRFILRDWTLQCEPNKCIFYKPVEILRISSCVIENVDNFMSAMHMTFSAIGKNPKEKVLMEKAMSRSGELEVLRIRENIPLDNEGCLQHKGFNIKTGDPSSRMTISPSIGCVELAGQCVFHGLRHLDKKAHQEFEFRLRSVLPSVIVDSSHICYND